MKVFAISTLTLVLLSACSTHSNRAGLLGNGNSLPFTGTLYCGTEAVAASPWRPNVPKNIFGVIKKGVYLVQRRVETKQIYFYGVKEDGMWFFFGPRIDGSNQKQLASLATEFDVQLAGIFPEGEQSKRLHITAKWNTNMRKFLVAAYHAQKLGMHGKRIGPCIVKK